MPEVVFLNGAFLPVAEARIGIYDGGFLHGAGLFETMRADFGRVFRLDQHLDRLLASATKLSLPIERPDLPLTKDFDQLLKCNDLVTARLRLTVTAGSMHPAAIADDVPKLSVCLTAAELKPYPADLYARGMSVMIAAFTQSTADPLAGHKTINYLPRLLALRSAQRCKCTEALWFTPDNYLAEGCLSNVFVVKDGALATPPLNTPVLPGVSRAVVLEIAERSSIKAEEKRLNINDVLDADEIFVTSSTMQVMPVCRVERKDIGTGRPGPITAALHRQYQEIVKAECNASEVE